MEDEQITCSKQDKLIHLKCGFHLCNNTSLQTKFNMHDYAADHADWSPREESATFLLKVPATDKYYELCLAAVIKTSTTYYLHQDLCSDVDMKTRVLGQAGTNLTIVPDISSVAVGWMENGKASRFMSESLDTAMRIKFLSVISSTLVSLVPGFTLLRIWNQVPAMLCAS